MSGAKRAILGLLEERGENKTICPSEAARILAGSKGNWRDYMEDVHLAVDVLISEKAISLSWKGEPKQERRGPYRIARRP